MNRNVIIGAIIVILAAGGYYMFGRSAPEVTEAVTEAAEGAAETATEAAEGATEAVTEGAEAAAEGAEAATEAVTEGAEAATEAVTDGAAAATDAAAALDPANFNADAVVALIDGSTLDDGVKTTLKTAVEAAKTNPALVADTIAQVKTALGM
jgi:colicin import membrane protein